MVDEYEAYKEKCRVLAKSATAHVEQMEKNSDAYVWFHNNRNDISLQLLGDLCKDKRIIAVGSGTWRDKGLLDVIDAREIIATDIVGHPEVDVVEADACALPYPSEYFDVLINRQLIEHVPDDRVLLAESRRVLVDGGYMLISTPNAYSTPINDAVHLRAYSPQYFIALLEASGFKVIKKAGNMPHLYLTLARLNGGADPKGFIDFWKVGDMTKNYEDLYYISTQLFVLCKKI